MPATYECLKAVHILENSPNRISCHVDSIYDSYQSRLAITYANASVVQINVGRLREWYAVQFPGVIHNKHGPREDSGSLFGSSHESSVMHAVIHDPAIRLVEETFMTAIANPYNNMNDGTHRAQVIAAGVRSRQDCLCLAGCDYISAPQFVIDQMATTNSGEAFSNEIMPNNNNKVEGVRRRLPSKSNSTNDKSFDGADDNETTTPFPSSFSSFDQHLCFAASDLMKTRLKRAKSSAKKIQMEFKKMYPPPNM